jgi:hypothetical protein
VLALPTMNESNVFTARGAEILSNPSESHLIRMRSALDKKAMQCIRYNNQAVNLLLLSSSLVLKNDNSLCIFG